MNISEYNICTVNVTKYKQTCYICSTEVELNGRYIWRNSPVNLVPLSSSSPLQWPAMPRKDLLLHLLVPWQVQEKLHSTCLCMYFKVEFLLKSNFHLFPQTCSIFHSTWIPPPFSLRWHVPVLALCRWLTLGLSSLGKIKGIAEGWQPTNPWFFQRIWDANEPTSFVAHSYDFAINGYVSLCGRSYQKSATCLRFIEIYVDFPWFWFTSFRSCCERNKGKLGTNYGPINELQVCLVLHASCSFQSCDCFKICRIVIYII